MRLPLAQRELTRLVRSRRVYAWRGLLIGAFAIMLFVQWISLMAYDGPVNPRTPEYVGRSMYVWCLVAELIILFVIIPALAAPMIVAERRDQMLPLLMLADFRGWDIFAAKALTIMVEAGFLLVALAPLEFMTTTFGGVAPEVVWARAAVIAAVLIFAIALALLCSSMFRNATAAVFAAMFALATALMALIALDEMLLHRGTRFTLGVTSALPLFFQPDSTVFAYRRCILVLLALAAACVIGILMLLPRIVVDPPRRYWIGAPSPYGHTPRRLLRWGPVQPILSLYSAGLTSTLRTPSIRILVMGLLAAIGCVPVVGALILATLLAHEIIAPMTSATRAGAIDDLRITPIPPRQLANDTLLFFWRKIILYVPGCAAVGMWLVLVVSEMPFVQRGEFGHMMDEQLLLGASFIIAMFALMVAFGFAQVFAMLNLGCLLSAFGHTARRQVVFALGLFGLAYTLCVSAASGFSYVLTYVYAAQGLLFVPLYLAGCVAVFAALGWAARQEFLRIAQGGRRPYWLTFANRSPLHDG